MRLPVYGGGRAGDPETRGRHGRGRAEDEDDGREMRSRLTAAAAVAAGAVALAAPGPGHGSTPVRAPGAAADTTVRASIPFRVDHGNLFVEVLINGTGPHDFMLDTGSPVTAMDRGLARKLGLEIESAGMASGAGGDSVPAGRVRGVGVRLDGEEAAGDDGVYVLPLDSLMSPMADRTVDGVVGYPFFRDRVVELDFDATALRVHDPERFRYAGPGHRLSMRVRGGWALLEAVADLPELGPTPVELMVDLGSRGNVLFTTPFVRRYRLDRALQDTARATVGMGLGGAARFLLARIDGVQLGSLWIPDVVAGFSTGEALPFGQFGGIVGTGILGRYRVVMDYRREEMILEEESDAGASGSGRRR